MISVAPARLPRDGIVRSILMRGGGQRGDGGVFGREEDVAGFFVADEDAAFLVGADGSGVADAVEEEFLLVGVVTHFDELDAEGERSVTLERDFAFAV